MLLQRRPSAPCLCSFVHDFLVEYSGTCKPEHVRTNEKCRITTLPSVKIWISSCLPDYVKHGLGLFQLYGALLHSITSDVCEAPHPSPSQHSERRSAMTRLSCRLYVCVGSVSLIHTQGERLDLGRGGVVTGHARVTFPVSHKHRWYVTGRQIKGRANMFTS